MKGICLEHFAKSGGETYEIRGSTAMKATHVRMTLRLERQLYERAKWHARRERADGINDFLVNAIAARVRGLERETIDRAFSAMAHDEQYQREALRIVEEFGG